MRRKRARVSFDLSLDRRKLASSVSLWSQKADRSPGGLFHKNCHSKWKIDFLIERCSLLEACELLSSVNRFSKRKRQSSSEINHRSDFGQNLLSGNQILISSLSHLLNPILSLSGSLFSNPSARPRCSSRMSWIVFKSYLWLS